MSEASEVEKVITPSAVEIPVAEFEGEFIRQFKGKVNLPVFEMDRGYARGTYLKIAMQLRVRDINVTEDRRGDLTREHTFALEEMELLGAYSAEQVDPGVGGNAAAGAMPDWVGPFVDFIENGVPLDWNQTEIPEPLEEMLDAYFDSEAQRSYNEVPGESAASGVSDLSEYGEDYIAQDHDGTTEITTEITTEKESDDVGF